MAHWEFFQQKVGDNHWQQLQGSDPEIPSGAYHLAIRGTHRPHQWIEVEIYPPEQAPTKRQKRFCQLDEQGFALIVPNLELHSGPWHIQCRSDILAALMGDHWEVNQCLQVTESLPVKVEPSQKTSEITPITEQMASQQDVEQLRSRLMNHADQMLEELVSDLLSPAVSFSEQNEDNSALSASYQIQLEQTYFIVNTEQSIDVSGQVVAPELSDSSQIRLQVTLRDPETAEVVVQLFPQVFEPPFPATFDYSLMLPESWSTSLLEGEVILLGTADQGSPVLARQSLTVTTAQKAVQPLQITASSEKLHSSASYQNQTSFQTRQSPDPVLPPKLFSRSYQSKPKLPQFPQKTVSQSNASAELESEQASVADTVTKTNANSDDNPLSHWELVQEVVITQQQSENS